MGRLYTKMKIFHFKDKIDSLPVTDESIRPPIHIRIKPTNVCNHHCRYCSYRSENLQLGRDMMIKSQIPREKMMEIIDDIVELNVKAVTFSGGGDPFCYAYLLDIVKRLSQTSIQFASLTNGSNLKGEIAEHFSQCATWLRISIDGWDNESYSRYRGVRDGEYTKILRNMEHFKSIGGKCYLGVSLIVDRENAAHIYDSIKRFNHLGVDSVKVSACVISDSGRENNRYHHSIFSLVKDQIRQSKHDFSSHQFEVYDAYHELDEKFEKEHTWCPYIQILPIIGADLNIYACQDKAYNLKEGLIGSLANQRFKDFWFSDKKKFYKINPSLHCNHHCLVNSRNKIILEYLNVDKKHSVFV